MAEPSRRRRRRTSEVSESNIRRRDATIEGWLSDEQDQQSFSQFWKERKLIKQKFIDLSWYTYYNFSFPNLIIEQGVQHIMELQGGYYSDLVRIFYFNLKVRDGVFQTRVKGVDIVLDNEIWTNVAKVPVLENSQIIPSDFPHFNKIMVYQSFLRNPRQRNTRLFLAGGLKMEERLLHYLIVWLLCPRGSNHAQCSETDLIIMYAITQSIPLNWPHLIQTIMFKAKRLDVAPLTYPLLVSQICEYKGVDITNEHYEHVLPGHKVGDNSLRQMGFIQQGLSYIHPEDAIGEQESEDDDANIPMPDPTNVAGPSQIHEDYNLESLSRQMTEMARLQNEMMNIQNTRHEEICTHLKNLDTRISGLERHFNSDASDEF
ncbi:hypothetical protein LR48_Vigan03g114900 [Vigna angularis]|uniref:Putative plant transposon protein domain-containing protein n=1 Tax=Phaseolus angularis TaxID=3914 RepID=A0A0L9U512_PHAAN|nr:hypothetical protein LR48_Vigan03g114900 [Vigna angularis]